MVDGAAGVENAVVANDAAGVDDCPCTCHDAITERHIRCDDGFGVDGIGKMSTIG